MARLLLRADGGNSGAIGSAQVARAEPVTHC